MLACMIKTLSGPRLLLASSMSCECAVKLGCPPARLNTARRTLDPDWGEEFYLEWSEVSAGKRHVLVEVWDWDFWRPDELLGRGFIDINALSFEPQEVGA
jgi:hypothetical protein